MNTMSTDLKLPIIDLSSPDKISTSRLIRQACLDHGYFYVTNHGVSIEMMEGVLRQSKNLFSLPLHEKMVMDVRSLRGYTPLKFPTTNKAGSKEMFTFGSSKGFAAQLYPNQWPSQDLLPLWKETMECYYKNIMDVGRKLLGLMALALNLEENVFERVGAFSDEAPVVRLNHYPGELNSFEEETYATFPHNDFGMITFLDTYGVPGLQVCRDKDKEPNVWEDVPEVKGAFVVFIGDLMERWTNGLFRSTLHRVVCVGKERYSVVVFMHSDPDSVVECFENCCSETSPPRFPPVRAGDYYLMKMMKGPR